MQVYDAICAISLYSSYTEVPGKTEKTQVSKEVFKYSGNPKAQQCPRKVGRSMASAESIACNYWIHI